jgi:O-antigen ligase
MVLGLEVVGLPFFWYRFYRSDSHSLGGRRPFVRVLLAAFLLLFLIVAAVMVFPDSRARVCRSYENFRRGGIASLLEARYYHWGNTLMMIRDHPLSGIGPGNFRVVYPLYAASFARDPLCNYQIQIYKAHNDYLQLAAECGIPALLFFLLLLGRQFYLLRYPDEGEGGEEDGGGRRWNPDWRLPLAASLSAYSVIMFFSFPLQMAYSRMFFFFLIALGEARAWPALLKR